MSSMVDFLIIGKQRDLHVSKVASLVEKSGHSLVVMDPTSRFPVRINATNSGNIMIEINDEQIDEAKVIWHPTKLASSANENNRTDFYETAITSEWNRFCTEVCYQLPGKIVNERAAEQANDCDQDEIFDLADQLGFMTLPRTAAAPALDPRLMSGPNVITLNDYKPMTVDDIDGVSHVRVLQVGDETHAYKLTDRTQDTDDTGEDNWKTDAQGPEITSFPLDIVIEQRLKQILARQTLDYATFDLIIDSDGAYWFINCKPDYPWTWLDHGHEDEIAETFANYFNKLLAP